MGYINRGPGTPPVLPSTPMAAYDGGWGPLLPFEKWPNYAEAKKNLPDIRALLQASDFFGVSNYARWVATGRFLQAEVRCGDLLDVPGKHVGTWENVVGHFPAPALPLAWDWNGALRG